MLIQYAMTKFEQAIAANIMNTISRALSDGTCGMSLDCLRQCTRPPSAHLEGSPCGTNTERDYFEMFNKAAKAMEQSELRGFEIYA